MFRDPMDGPSDSQSSYLPPRSCPASRLVYADTRERIRLGFEYGRHAQVQKLPEDRKPKRGEEKEKRDNIKIARKDRYHFKYHGKETRKAELEAYSAAICAYLATSRYVPSVHSYYDDEGQVVSVASKEFDKFQSNYQDPLTKEDVIVNSLFLEIEQRQRELLYAIEKLLSCLNKHPGCRTYRGYFGSFCYSFFDSKPTAYLFRKYLMDYQAFNNKFSIGNLDQLAVWMKARRNYIHENSKVSSDPIAELKLLNQIRDLIPILKKLDLTLAEDEKVGIELLENFDRTVIKENIDLDHCDVFPLEFVNPHNITVKALQNYRQVRGLATSLTTRFIEREGDNNNSNMDKKGRIIDFDWTKAHILAQFKEHDLFHKIFRCPDEHSFACTEHNIQYFPDIDTNLWYWPAKQAQIVNIIIDVLSVFLDDCAKLHVEDEQDIHRRVANLVLFHVEKLGLDGPSKRTLTETMNDFLDGVLMSFKSLGTGMPIKEFIDQKKIKTIFGQLKQELLDFSSHYADSLASIEEELLEKYGNTQNRFTREDNKVFKSLATHPVFIFHKYKTCLKYILTDIDLYRCQADLNIVKNKSCLMNEEIKLLEEEVVKDECARQAELRQCLINMQDFVNFLKQDGDYAFALIAEECKEYKEKYENKVEEKPYYQPLAAAIDIDKMQEKYDYLCMLLDVREENTLGLVGAIAHFVR